MFEIVKCKKFHSLYIVIIFTFLIFKHTFNGGILESFVKYSYMAAMRCKY